MSFSTGLSSVRSSSEADNDCEPEHTAPDCRVVLASDDAYERSPFLFSTVSCSTVAPELPDKENICHNDDASVGGPSA
jgi:hypothetical protein